MEGSVATNQTDMPEEETLMRDLASNTLLLRMLADQLGLAPEIVDEFALNELGDAGVCAWWWW